MLSYIHNRYTQQAKKGCKKIGFSKRPFTGRLKAYFVFVCWLVVVVTNKQTSCAFYTKAL
jgi:hypothetical protein